MRNANSCLLLLTLVFTSPLLAAGEPASPAAGAPREYGVNLFDTVRPRVFINCIKQAVAVSTGGLRTQTEFLRDGLVRFTVHHHEHDLGFSWRQPLKRPVELRAARAVQQAQRAARVRVVRR